MAEAIKKDDDELIREITQKERTGEVTEATLVTDDRVLARITDGIYRQPASALRELIANAYDADAAEVSIHTDPPRFSRIVVRDNGLGMNKAALVRLINHIGGSLKRTYDGAELGVTSATDPSLSPGGRRLIGKIGIGLFSVSQLTRRFRIISKQAHEKYRLVAEVSLRTYSEDDLAKSAPPETGDHPVVTGRVSIQSVPADNSLAHGTEIILLELHPAARDMLRSRDMWERVSSPDGAGLEDYGQKFSPPSYHVGQVDPKTENIIKDSANLPWKPEDSPLERFHKLHDAVIKEVGRRAAKPRLEATLDRYLHTLWILSLSAPLDYIGGIHPFDLGPKALPRFYLLSNKADEQSNEIKLRSGHTLRETLQLKAPQRGSTTPFKVFVDEVELRRPLRFDDLPSTSSSDENRRPLMFVGKCAPPLDKMPPEVTGGRALSFEAYFLWTPKVVPTDHNGVMVRISDASGTLFDDTFFGYQVAELTRLSQITAEVFVLQGLDAALNIDRESFNFGHPHAKILSSWVHRALRQLATMQKRIAKTHLEHKRAQHVDAQTDRLQAIVDEKAGDREPPKVVFVDNESDKNTIEKHRYEGHVVLNRATVLARVPEPKKSSAGTQKRTLLEKRLAAVAQLLEAYGVFKRLSYEKQQELLNGIAAIFGGDE